MSPALPEVLSVVFVVVVQGRKTDALLVLVNVPALPACLGEIRIVGVVVGVLSGSRRCPALRTTQGNLLGEGLVRLLQVIDLGGGGSIDNADQRKRARERDNH